MQCETLLGLARESTKKRRNKKIGYNVIDMTCTVFVNNAWCFLANPFTLHVSPTLLSPNQKQKPVLWLKCQRQLYMFMTL